MPPKDKPGAVSGGASASEPAIALVNVPGIENVSQEFKLKVVQIARELGCDPNFLMAVMSFESGGTFSPSKKNAAGSGAVGLIQFMPQTAKSLGTSTAQLAQMTPERQLDFVAKYLAPFKGRLNTIEDVYMAVLMPSAIGRGPNHVLFRRPTKAYAQNEGLDLDGDGVITVAEAAERVRRRLGPLAPDSGLVALGRGMTGPEVDKLQDELIDLGYMTLAEKRTGPGRFGPRTEAALKAFQKDNHLAETGVADAPTQAAIAQINAGVRIRSEGGVVRVVQERLLDAGYLTAAQLATGPGTFGPRTQAALMRFQLDHGIQPSGILTDETYRALYKTVPKVKPKDLPGEDDRVDAVLPESGTGYTTYNRELNGADQFGRASTIRALEELGRAWFARHPAIRLQFGDISRRGGGPFFNAKDPSHLDHTAHRDGRDVDIRPLTRNGAEEPTNIFDANYDPGLTKELVQLIKAKFPKAKVLFNDPQLVAAGLTKKASGHHNHLHVSFR
jgi:peptidoglycan hydrolase-like protein with peptidoglycan-binding domain